MGKFAHLPLKDYWGILNKPRKLNHMKEEQKPFCFDPGPCLVIRTRDEAPVLWPFPRGQQGE